MKKNFVYLASASPRRRELLEQIGVAFEAMPAQVDEGRLDGESPEDYVKRVSKTKAAAVLSVVKRGFPVLAADTAVVVDGETLGKPADEADAMRMLELLSGRDHVVLTAVCLRGEDFDETRICRSKVRFRPTTAGERRAYCLTGEPMDKAGAYAIQGKAAVFVEHIRGSYSAVMGLPLFETANLLARFGLPNWLAGD